MELCYSYDYDYGSEDITYEVDNSDVVWALGDILFENYFDTKSIKGKELKETIKKGIRFMISDMDGTLADDLLKNLCKEFSQEIHEYFEDDAWDSVRVEDWEV